MTKKTQRLAAAILGSIGLLTSAVASADSASASALITVRVLGHADEAVAEGAVTVTKVSDLDFGTIPVRARRGAAVVAPGSSHAATYRIGGARNASFAVALPEEAVVRNGASVIVVKAFTRSGASGGQLSEAGTAMVGVGASLDVAPEQAPGVYSGSFPLTVAYN